MNKVEISVDIITGEVIQKVSQFTAEELANSETLLAEETARKQLEAAAKTAALAKLTALGLTTADLTALGL